MDRKTLLQALCRRLEEDLNERKETDQVRTVDFFSGLRPSDYHISAMHIGTSYTAPTENVMAWFVDIVVDGKVIFRECQIPIKSEDLDALESMLINKVLRNVFTFGVMSSKKFIDENSNQTNLK